LYRLFLVVVLVFPTRELLAQTNATAVGAEISSRSGEIQNERLAKDSGIPDHQADTGETAFSRLTTAVRAAPIWIQSGGLGPGAGIGLGLSLSWEHPQNRVTANLSGTATLHEIYTIRTLLEKNDSIARNVTVGLAASHSDAPQLEYYGLGPDSSIHNRTNYRKEETDFDLRLERRGRFVPACRISYSLINVGPGTNGAVLSSERIFGPLEAPGINVQSNFAIAGCSMEADLRDFPEDPHQGTYAAVAYDRFLAQLDNHFSFHRLSGVVEHYIPFWNRKRVIALRAVTDLSLHSAGQIVPFYLDPTLGSDTDLRGFARYRFYDENLLSMNAEYRWEIGTGVDFALFADAGRVFHRPEQIGISKLEGSAGFGLRVKNRDKVLMRLDTGFSREGFQVWLKFGRLY
jgi:surface antigen Omp85-like protein